MHIAYYVMPFQESSAKKVFEAIFGVLFTVELVTGSFDQEFARLAFLYRTRMLIYGEFMVRLSDGIQEFTRLALPYRNRLGWLYYTGIV